MEDKQFLTLLENVSTQTNSKQLNNSIQKLLQILLAAEKQAQLNNTYIDTSFGKTFQDLQYTLEKAIGGLQSLDYNVQKNHALLLGSILHKFQLEIQVQSVISYAHDKLSSKEAYNKREFKHFQLGQQMLYAELQNLQLLQNPDSLITELTQKDDHLSEGNVFILLKIIFKRNSNNWKQIAQAIKNDLKNMTPQILSILIQLQKTAQLNNQSFPWNQLIQERIFNRSKFTPILHQQLAIYPRKSIFYYQLINYLSQFTNQEQSNEIFQEFWDYLVDLQDDIVVSTRKNFLVLQFLIQYLKQIGDLNLIKNQKLIEFWYRQLANGQKVIKNKAGKVLKYVAEKIEDNEDFFLFIRSIYGYRLSPRNPIAMKVFSKWSQSQVVQYFKQNKKQLHSAQSLQERMYYINEIYVLAELSFKQIKDQLYSRILFYIYQQTIETHIQSFYDSLEDKDELDQFKENIIDQCQSYFYSLIGNSCSQTKIEELYLSELYKQFEQQCSKVSENKEIISNLSQFKFENLTVPQWLHLVSCIKFFTFFNPEEGIQILNELDSILNQIEKKPGKKMKNNSGNENQLLEIIIQLLTKAPTYLRDAIKQCFTLMIPQLNNASVTILIEVIKRKNDEYIDEMNKDELKEEIQQSDEDIVLQ